MANIRPFALSLFVPSGLPEGMCIVEKMTRSCIGYMIPRSQFKEFNQLTESGRPGLCLLTGPEPEAGGADLAYIGKADPLGRHLGSTRPRSSGPRPIRLHVQGCLPR
jgi:hypothetical protein